LHENIALKEQEETL